MLSTKKSELHRKATITVKDDAMLMLLRRQLRDAVTFAHSRGYENWRRTNSGVWGSDRFAGGRSLCERKHLSRYPVYRGVAVLDYHVT